MHPEELWDKLRKAFNWPPYRLAKNYGSSPNSYPRLWVDIGAENISQMRADLLELARRGTTVQGYPNEVARTGYYFRTDSRTYMTIQYYDNETRMVTICNPKPYASSSERKFLEDEGMWTNNTEAGNSFFLNKYPAIRAGFKIGSSPTMLGQTYMEELPTTVPFLNWMGSKPLSSRK